MTRTDPYTEALAAGLTTARDTDLYGLYERLSPAERELQLRVREFVTTRVLPVINGYWERAEFPFELLPHLAGLGVVGGTIRGHGAPGLSPLAAGIVTAELSRGDGSVNTFLGVQSNLVAGTIDLLADEEQRRRWLPALIRLERIGAFALTEPRHGSDSVALETTATRHGDDWVIDGQKRWIGNASIADLVIVWARDTEDGRVKAFVLERDAAGQLPAGYETEVITGKIGKRAILQPDVWLQQVRVPERNRLPGAQGFRDAARVLARTRAGAAWEALGHATALYEAALSYASAREQFGGPIARFQLVQDKLANIAIELTAIQLFLFRAAELQQQGSWTGTQASIAKKYTAQRARWIAGETRDILGGNGLLLDFHVARHLTDLEVVHTYEGTDSIQSLLIGRELTGISAFS